MLFPLLLCATFVLSVAPSEKLPDDDDFTGQSFYHLTPLKIGAQVRGLELSTDLDPEIVKQIVRDTYTHQLLVFKDQGQITAERHLAISKWFGRKVDITHRRHEKAEHPYVFRVSNDKNEGFVGVGNKGWHIDGFFTEKPHTFVMYYMPHVPKRGSTVFVDLYEVVKGLSASQRARWEKIYTRARIRTNVIHPLIYTHPVTRKETICINLDFVKEFISDYNTTNAKTFNEQETKMFMKEIKSEFEQKRGKFLYPHVWEEGDFVMTDNLALAHIADTDTQRPREEIGLRVLHRVSIAGSLPPLKNPPQIPNNPMHITDNKQDTGRIPDEL